MKLMLATPVLAALLLSACSQSPSSDTAVQKDAAAATDMAMSEAKHAKMADGTATPQTEAAMAKMALATGTVEAVDATTDDDLVGIWPWCSLVGDGLCGSCLGLASHWCSR